MTALFLVIKNNELETMEEFPWGNVEWENQGTKRCSVNFILIKPKDQIKSPHMHMLMDTYISISMALKDTIKKMKRHRQRENIYKLYLIKVCIQNIREFLQFNTKSV